MNWFFSKCRRNRQSLSLLAGGALGKSERTELERHLTDCPECREYYQQLQRVTQSLTDYRQSVAGVEPTPAAKQRWTRAIHTAQQSKRAKPKVAAPSPAQWCHELFWSCRRAWVGIAAAWFLMWWVNWEGPQIQNGFAETSTVAQTYAEERRMLAELMPISNSESAEEPRHKPSPHSERQRPWTIA